MAHDGEAGAPPIRFFDSGIRLEDFLSEVWVRCPRCDAPGVVTVAAPPYWSSTPRFGCHGCALRLEGRRTQWFGPTANLRDSDGREPAFGLELRLQTRCAGHLLWAYNPAHLDFIDHYVRADLREREGTMNGSLASRLPKWMKSSRHRNEIRRAIARLQQLTI